MRVGYQRRGGGANVSAVVSHICRFCVIDGSEFRMASRRCNMNGEIDNKRKNCNGLYAM